MLNYFALIDNSDSGDMGVAILLMFIIIALTIAVPAAILGWVIYHLAKGSKAKSSKNKSKKQNRPSSLPYVVGCIGLVLIVANIGGSKYSDRSILFDTILLSIPFLLALIASFSSVKTNTRKVLLAGIILSTLIFLAYHYES